MINEAASAGALVIRSAREGDAEAMMRKRVPLVRYGTIEEVCEAVLYLVSPAAAFVTGTTLLIDGGTSLLGAAPFLELMGE